MAYSIAAKRDPFNKQTILMHFHYFPISLLKDHNLVTVHAPYFDSPTGCRKFKRRDELYRTFKIRLHRAQLSSILP